MENDYLWDKMGEDAEIQELEKTLQVFRYQESNAPKLPIAITETTPKFSIFSLRFALAFATCIALLFGGLLALSKLMQQPNLGETAINQNSIERPQIVLNTPKADLPTDITEESSQPKFIAKPMNISYRQKQVSSPVIRQIKSKKVVPKIVLTKEEQYAYDQLMLALSITCSKLKQVQDKVNGGEENTTTIKSLK